MSKPAARLGDNTAHGGVIVKGEPTVLIGGMPAARLGDMHTCPMVNPGVPPPPHVGGPIVLGSTGVLIGNMPAARMGDMVTCAGPPDTIIKGCPTVLIGEVGVVPPQPPKPAGFWAGVWDALSAAGTWISALKVAVASAIIAAATLAAYAGMKTGLAAAGASKATADALDMVAKAGGAAAAAALFVYGAAQNASTTIKVYKARGMRAASKLGTQLAAGTAASVVGGVLAGRLAGKMSAKFGAKIGKAIGKKPPFAGVAQMAGKTPDEVRNTLGNEGFD